MNCTRRDFVGGLTIAGTAGLLGLRPDIASAEPPPETKRIRLVQTFAVCEAPQYVAEELLRAEGFTDVQYVQKDSPAAIAAAVSAGEADVSMQFSGPLILRVERGEPITILAGIHPGCYELFTAQPVRSLLELKGRTIAIRTVNGPEHIFLSSMMAYVGLDPRKDIQWVTYPAAESMELLGQGKIDAFMGFPPDPQELRARKIGHVLVNSAVDRPWSQYFCCMVVGNREFVQRNPVATKRAIRAILKASEICALQPERVARFLVDKGYVERSDYAVQSMKEVVYGKWREYDPNDAVRFYSLRLHEAGMIKSTPQKIIAQGTDWRFFNELKKELKG